MPKRTDINKIMMIGSGPIVIGQACEFDYSGTQACKVLRDDGYEIVLINSNPATIMTDPEFADKTYIEPITPDIIAKIIEKERPDALLPTLGGQTALNMAVAVAERGVLEEYGVEMIGASLESIKKAEDRRLFKQAMERIGCELPNSGFAHTLVEANELIKQIGFPVVIRPSFTLGGAGGGMAYNLDEFNEIVANGLMLSPVDEVLIEESVQGWKEYELEVMRDIHDNAVIVCSIENLDPMGVHTGDSVTVAPAQTLTDKEYQEMRDEALAIMSEIGVATGGSNIQFAVDPATGKRVVVEMNPRVSRSSALASKATGFPIAKIAAKLAVGYTLDEIVNDITRETPACFEPTIDYVVVKMPRWTFEKFPDTDQTLTTKMKSVGEAMAIGRTFKEALQKVIRSLEIGRFGLGADGRDEIVSEELEKKLSVANQDRLFYIKYALANGMTIGQVCDLSGIDPWFIAQIADLVELEARLEPGSLNELESGLLRTAKRAGYSDVQIAHLKGSDEGAVRARRQELGIVPTYKTVDTCAAEFEAYTPYYYSTYEVEDEVEETDKPKIMILGGGPNRIGQGIEFDYCCVHASFALREDGYETIMVNCNPETVSTDYDTSDRLYFEPLTFEDVMNIVERERPVGVIVQFGGQTPLRLAGALEDAGVNILGTTPDSIDLAEDRQRFGDLLQDLSIPQAENGTARSYQEAMDIAARIGYPLLVRPSYVLGGRAMQLVYSAEMLEGYMTSAVKASPEHPVLIDKFLEGAIEVDVDALCDGSRVLIGGIMEHIEEAGIHSGDSACAIPAFTLSDKSLAGIKDYTVKLAQAVQVVGLLNIQFAVKDEAVYVIEVNPRASRTIPFVSKAIGVPLAKNAAKVMAGRSLADLDLKVPVHIGYTSVKEAVLPFDRFPGVDTILGPEMRSTGEVMGIAPSFGVAYAKSQMAAGFDLPAGGQIFISVCDRDKRGIQLIARQLSDLGYRLAATKGTATVLRHAGIEVTEVVKVTEGRPNVLDLIINDEVHLVINTPWGRGPRADGHQIRMAAATHGVACVTTMAAAQALVQGLQAVRDGELSVKALQEYYPENTLAADDGVVRVPGAAMPSITELAPQESGEKIPR